MYKTFNVGSNDTCSAYCNCRIAATQLHPRITVCFRYVIVNTLHDGDNKINNNNNIVLLLLLFSSCLLTYWLNSKNSNYIVEDDDSNNNNNNNNNKASALKLTI